MYSHICIIPKLNSENGPSVQRVVSVITDIVQQCNIPLVSDVDSTMAHVLIFAVGGDGTMLEAMRCTIQTNATAVGINMGNVGFLTDFSAANVDHMSFKNAIYELITNPDPTLCERRSILVNDCTDQIAVNEISISSVSADTMITYELLVDDNNAGIHRANSLLISTPTGSTAYSLAAGGAIMMPTVNALQIIPVAPASLTSRPLITSIHSEIHVRAWGRGISVRCDGQLGTADAGAWTKDDPFEITITSPDDCAYMYHIKGWNFFNTLSSKLGWIKS